MMKKLRDTATMIPRSSITCSVFLLLIGPIQAVTHQSDHCIQDGTRTCEHYQPEVHTNDIHEDLEERAVNFTPDESEYRECMVREINNYRHVMIHGDPESGVPVQDPWNPESLTFTLKLPVGESLVTLHDGWIFGLSEFNITQAVPEWDKKQGVMKLHFQEIRGKAKIKSTVPLISNAYYRNHFDMTGENVEGVILAKFRLLKGRIGEMESITVKVHVLGDLNMQFKGGNYFSNAFVYSMIDVRSIFNSYKIVLEKIMEKYLFLQYTALFRKYMQGVEEDDPCAFLLKL